MSGYTVTFELPVHIDEQMAEEIIDEVIDGEPTDEELEELAREILYDAPAFDDIGAYAISHQLKLGRIDRE